MHQDELDYIPSKGITRGATRGETMQDGFIRKYLHGDIRKSDGMVFYAYRYRNGKYQENWRSQESYQKSLKHDVEAARIYRKVNADKVKKANRRWVENNREKYNAISYKWIKNNPERAVEFAGRRRARERNACLMIGRDQQRIIDSMYDYSQRLTSCLGILHHVDHIIPISRGGYHIHTNMQVLPASINSRKKDKLPHEFANAA
jgi:hypothetical protein